MAVIIEIYAMLFLSKNAVEYEPGLSMSNIPIIIFKTIKATIENIPYTFLRLKIFNRMFFGILILAITLWRYIKNKNIKIFIWCLLGIVAMYFMGFFKRAGSDEYVMPSSWFYNSISATIGALLIVKWIYDDFYRIYKNRKIFKVLTCVSFLMMICFFYIFTSSSKPDYIFTDNIYEIEPKVNFSGTQIEEVVISPNSQKQKWVTYVPID